MMTDRTEFVSRMIATLPELRGRYDALLGEVGDEDGAAYLLVDEYTRELLAAGQAPAIQRLAAALEEEFGRSGDVDSLIGSGFVALFGDRTPETDPAGLLMPKLRAQVDRNRLWRARPTDAALVARLVAVVPSLRPLAEENMFGDHGDVLTHPFLGDVADREADLVADGELDEPRAVMRVLEDEIEARDTIATGFLEYLPDTLAHLLGPTLAEERQQLLHDAQGDRGSSQDPLADG